MMTFVVACGARTELYVLGDATVADAADASDDLDAGFTDIVFDVPEFDVPQLLTCEEAGAMKGSVGCDYIVPTPSFYAQIAPPCWAVFVANDTPVPVQIAVARGATQYDPTKFGRLAESSGSPSTWPTIPPAGVPAGQVAVLFMEDDPSSTNTTPMTCPIPPAIEQQYGTELPGAGSQASLTGVGTAWHIATDVPVQMFDILPYGGASTFLPSAELLIPTASLGTNYFGVVPQRGTSSPQWGQIVATGNATSITVFPNVSLPSGPGVAAAPANVATSFQLNAGQYVQWQDSSEMSGTIIQSNKPVGFFGGHGNACYADSTSTGGGCDSVHQQIPPIVAFGSEYAVPAYTTRRLGGAPESIRYRFVGAVAGTKLAYDPPLSAAPTSIGVGQAADFEATGSFVVRSQDNLHPFYVGQVMTGCQVTDGSWNGGCLGDEEYVNILAPAQFLDSYVFFTDPTYAYTNLVFTRVRGPNGFEDVSLDCVPSPLGGWTSIDGAGKYEITNVWLVKDGTPQGSCMNGPHTAKSAGTFGVMVWGLDKYSSYAYPAGGNIAPINTVVVPPVPH